MIISHKYKFVLIDIPKTASSCLNFHLAPLLGKEDVFCMPDYFFKWEALKGKKIDIKASNIQDKPCDNLGLDGAIFGKVFPRHANIKNVLSTFPESESYFKICFVRNTWDRMLSMYKMHFEENRLYSKVNKKAMTVSDFHSYLTNLQTPMNEEQTNLSSQLDWMFDGEELKIDFVGKFSRLQNDFDYICDKLGLPIQKLVQKNKSRYVSETRPYQEYYEEKTKDFVAKRYKREIDYFKFEF